MTRQATHPYNDFHIAPEVPFKLAPSPSRGWGAFATRNITSGSVIIRETALFTIYKPQLLINNSDISSALRVLAPSAQQQFLRLRDNGNAEFRFLTDAFSENCFLVPGPGGAHGTGCYILLSRINHSCVPNAKIPDTAIEGASIACFSTRDIAAGEEITFCYNPSFIYRTSRDRHGELRFVCECEACTPGTVFHCLSEMRRTLIRGLQYLSHGRDFDGRRRLHVISDAKLRGRAHRFRIGVANSLVYSILKMVLLEQEGLLDRIMLERMQPGICHLIMAFESVENLALVSVIMANVSWEERLGASLKLWGRKDEGDEVWRTQLKMRDRLRGQ